jgi:hypothetical protein
VNQALSRVFADRGVARKTVRSNDFLFPHDSGPVP